ncbi:QDE-2-interacting protein [Seiridium cupressi]
MEYKPMHAGLLRDETFFLRQIFGYADTREIGRNLSLCGSASKLPASSISDLLLVAIDIDTREGYDQIISNQQLHVGVSLFDSRSVETSGATTSSYFGQSESILISELKPRLEQAVSARDVVLVLHGAEQDLEVLKNLRIDLHPIFVVDTVKAAQHPLGLHYRYSLEKLLEALGIPFTNLHAAGNDAHFALRALLMIVVKDAESQPSTPSITTLTETLKSIALGPRPPSRRELLTPQEEARRQGKLKAEQNSESKKNYWLKRHAKAKRKATRRLESENQAIGLAGPPNNSPNEMEEDNTESALFEGT